MALQSITNINVDFYDKKYILINAKQYDRNSRFLSVTCYNHGELFALNSAQHSAYIRYKKSDEHSVFNFCEITNEGKILVELTEQMLVSGGICYADLVIVNKGNAKVDEDTGEIVEISGGVILSTMTFCIDVSETATENSNIESSYEYNGLNEALIKAEAEYAEVIQKVKTYSENSATNALNAALSELNAANSATAAATSEDNALASANRAATSESNAASSALSANISASNAETSKTSAQGFATTAQNSMNSAVDSATSASTSAANAYNYYLQAEAITNGLNGAFLPKGTVTFAELIALKESGSMAAGYLYHISDNFTTDENFRVSGKECGAGTSVYYTVDNKLDCFVGTTVSGVKGEKEAEYRTGMVNITPNNIGAIASADIVTVDEMKSYLGI